MTSSSNGGGAAARDAATSFLAMKLAIPAAALFIVFLLLIGIMGVSVNDAAANTSCGGIGQPSVEGPEGGEGEEYETIREEQEANAGVIDKVAAELGMPGRATHVALITALQESNLVNIDYGDRDSVGLFQQRPSQGWGSVKQIMDPTYSARMFFKGGANGDPKGLEDIREWEEMPMGDAAQAVQKSGFPDAYEPHEARAEKIAEDAGINLSRSGDESDPGDVDESDDDDECYPDDGKDSEGAQGEPFYDGESDWPSAVKNPRSAKRAIEAARAEAESGNAGWYRLCLAFVAEMYGWNFSGVIYAIDHYRQMPSAMKNDGDRNPPPGALMYWDTGQRAGHVAVYLGDGKIASNDISRPGYIDVVDATAPETKWSAKYVGWAPPYFPMGG